MKKLFIFLIPVVVSITTSGQSVRIPNLCLGTIQSGDTIEISQLQESNRLRLVDENGDNIDSLHIFFGRVDIQGNLTQCYVLDSGLLNLETMRIIEQAISNKVSIIVDYAQPSRNNMAWLHFYVRSPVFIPEVVLISDKIPIQVVNNDKIGLSKLIEYSKIELLNKNGHPAGYEILNGEIFVERSKTKGLVLPGGNLADDALELIKLSDKKRILIKVLYKDSLSGRIGEASLDFRVGILMEFVFGDIEMGDSASFEYVQTLRKVNAISKHYTELNSLEILSGVIKVNGVEERGGIIPGGDLDDAAIGVLKQSKGKQVTVLISYKVGGIKKKSGLAFSVY